MINGISNQIAIAKTAASTGTGQTTQQFSTFLKDSINELNNAQRASDIATEKLAKGENVELQDVMITAQKQVLRCKRLLKYAIKLLKPIRK